MIHPSVAIVVDAAAFHFAIGAAAMTDMATVVTTVIKIAATINVIVMMIEKTDVMTTGLGDKTKGAAPTVPFCFLAFPL